MNNTIRITDVSPRDGLQNEPRIIGAAEKARLVELLCDAGVDEVEVSSFVSSKWVPQLGDASEVFALIASRPHPRPLFSALVPNEKGLASALEVNARAGEALIGKVSVFTAASETFSARNTNATIAQTIERFVPVVEKAHGAGLAVRGYVSCIVACPFEGPIGPAAVTSVVRRLLDIGVDEIDLGDTIGAGTVETIRAVLDATLPLCAVPTLHLHDTFGRAGDCVREALAMGVRSFDASVAGLGGCPYASTPGRPAPGNIATELLLEVAEREGFVSRVNRERLVKAAGFARGMRASSGSE